MLDKAQLIDFINDEIESCELVKTPDDKAIIWELKRLKRQIEFGRFDIESGDTDETR